MLVLYKKVAQGDEGWKVGKNGVREVDECEREREIEFKIIITLKISTQNVDFVHVF